MSFIRAGSEKLFSDSDDEGLYVFLGGAQDELYIEDYDGLENPENLCEVIFRILDQSGVEVDLEMVNKVRRRLELEELDDIGIDYEKRV